MNYEDARRLPAVIDSVTAGRVIGVKSSRAQKLAASGAWPLVETGDRRKRVATKPFLAALGIDWIGPEVNS